MCQIRIMASVSPGFCELSLDGGVSWVRNMPVKFFLSNAKFVVSTQQRFKLHSVNSRE